MNILPLNKSEKLASANVEVIRSRLVEVERAVKQAMHTASIEAASRSSFKLEPLIADMVTNDRETAAITEQPDTSVLPSNLDQANVIATADSTLNLNDIRRSITDSFNESDRHIV